MSKRRELGIPPLTSMEECSSMSILIDLRTHYPIAGSPLDGTPCGKLDVRMSTATDGISFRPRPIG
jgi:hypothetical protein